MITLTIISFALYSRYMRASMLDVINTDYVRTARAKGLPENKVIMRHVFRNALIPIVTIAALNFGGLLGGAIVTETRLLASTGWATTSSRSSGSSTSTR